MNRRRTLLAGLAVVTLLPAAGGALASDEYRYGWQLMTPRERAEHRQTMRSLETVEAREAYRLEHYEAMRMRAAEQGVTMPERPAPRGQGYGRGRGPRRNN